MHRLFFITQEIASQFTSNTKVFLENRERLANTTISCRRRLFYKNNSKINTIAQAEAATVMRLFPNHAITTAPTKATDAAIGLSVAVIISGKVMTARVTTGT